MCMFEIESFIFPITVLIKDPSQDLFLQKEKYKKIDQIMIITLNKFSGNNLCET